MNKKKIQEELNRFNQIYKYKYIITEQDAPPEPLPGEGDPAGDVPPPPPGDVPPPPPGDVPPPGDMPPPPDTDMLATPETGVEEVDITDLVNMTKSIKKELESNKGDSSGVMGKMDDIFTKLNDLEQKLATMDSVMARIDMLSTKIDTVRPKTPEEKLEMRSLDSYPFNQNPQQFFASKHDEMRQTGKNEYVLTKNDVENYSKDTIRDTFNPENQEDEFKY